VSDHDDVIAASRRRSAALIARDPDALRALLHPGLRWTLPSGEVRDLERYVAGTTAGELVWRDQQFSDVDVVVVGDTAVLTALVHDEYERAGVPGAHDVRLTLTWVREEGAWRVLAGHSA
jgi:hypothetical protein